MLAHPDAIVIPEEQIARGLMFVAEIRNEMVGFAAIEPRPDGDVDLDALFVDPRLQRQGIGRALVNHCGLIAQGRGSKAIRVVGNPHAAAFYESSGFKTCGTVQTRFGLGLLMYKPLHADGR